MRGGLRVLAGLAAGCLVLGAQACSRGAERSGYFPIGIYAVDDPGALAMLRREGFAAVQSYRREPDFLSSMAAAARKSSMKLLIHPHEIMASTAVFRNFPIAAWYLADEPDVNKISPEALLALDSQVRRWSPNARTAFVVGNGQAAGTYKDAGDVVMVDWYPVPHRPLESAGDHVRWAVEAAGGKPVWAVLQAMNWKEYPQRDPRRPRVGRFPDMAEIRFMAYDAIVQGANGLWFFAYTRPSGEVLSDAPEEWFAVTAVSRELATLRPILERGKPITLPFEPGPNRAQGRAWRFRGRDYVVVLNRKKDRYQKLPKDMLDRRWRPLFEPRRDARELLRPMHGAWYLRPYQVLVFEGPLGWRRRESEKSRY